MSTMVSSVFESQLQDEEVLRELTSTRVVQGLAKELPDGANDSLAQIGPAEAVERLAAGRARLEAPMPAEAIVMRHGYPSLLVRNGTYERPRLTTWQRRLDPHADAIRQAISGVGRIELRGHRAEWVGTCWLVDDDTLITNRHVAEVFLSQRSRGTDIRRGVRVNVDFLEEYDNDGVLEYLVRKIDYVESLEPDIDLALLKLEPGTAAGLGIAPIPIAETHERAEWIGVIGYPARDVRNPVQDMSRIFQDIYEVKRFAPGKVMDPNARQHVFTHNCTTLGGNSGSAVIDVSTGSAVGLHFAGSALQANFAVKAEWIRDRLAKRNVSFLTGETGADDELDGEASERRRRQSFRDRDGYRANFIGNRGLRLPLPRLNAIQAADVARTRDGERVLKYRHFSVVMSERRRLAYFAAANVDGTELRRPRRVGFKSDPRLRDDQQADNALYRNNDFDRGHLIRRLDPCWGTAAEAREANRDSMFFPNIAPQHKNLNQRLWLDLEEHILENTDDENAKISVFVGCIFDEDDPPHHRTGIRVPMGFWKVVASSTRPSRSRRRRRRLQAQAFILSQEQLVRPRDFERAGTELIFGGVEGVQQVTVEELERLTGLDFHVLREADTFGMEPDVHEQLVQESIETEPGAGTESYYKPVHALDDVVL